MTKPPAEGAAARRGGRRRGITGRALVLGAVLILLVVVLASPVHRYVATRSALSQAEQERRANQAELVQLQKQVAQWNDPAYIAQQARARLQFAMPGDTVYVVVTPNTKPATGAPAPRDSTATRVPGDSWNERLWGSIRTADSSP
jgi:cell division protein FtsB